jgi:2-dehydro-3-deoxyphosphogluconate aldolase / (4S)-4-hydroxy-2-oxoglutarate aldolase
MTESTIEKRLQRAPVVPLVAPTDAPSGIRTARALVDGGLTVVEVVLRTPAAIDCLGEIAQAVPDAIVGAGTVLGEEQAAAVLDRGARFLVSPGLYEPVVRLAHDAGVPVFPGVATASEAQQAWNLGLRTLKFFPASLAGGTAMIRALGAVFRDVRFMPTGGVSAANLADYLALPNVLACGGSWLTPADAIAQGRFDAVTAQAREAVAVARAARG